MAVQEEYPKMYLYHRLVKAKLYIDSHYYEQIDLDNISDEAYFSKFHFIRAFKKIFGKTPHQYRIHVRIQRAKELLCDDKQIADVCMEVGFESVSSFTGLFKKICGQTPSRYQMQQLDHKRMCNAKPFQFIPGCYAGMHGWKEKSNFEEAAI